MKNCNNQPIPGYIGEDEPLKAFPWHINEIGKGKAFFVIREIKGFWTWHYINEKGKLVGISCNFYRTRDEVIEAITEMKTSMKTKEVPMLEEISASKKN